MHRSRTRASHLWWRGRGFRTRLQSARARVCMRACVCMCVMSLTYCGGERELRTRLRGMCWEAQHRQSQHRKAQYVAPEVSPVCACVYYDCVYVRTEHRQSKHSPAAAEVCVGPVVCVLLDHRHRQAWNHTHTHTGEHEDGSMKIVKL